MHYDTEKTVKTNVLCDACKKKNVYKVTWVDYYPEGSRHYKNYICLDCGRHVFTSGLYSNMESVRNMKKELGLITQEELNLVKFKEFLNNLEN